MTEKTERLITASADGDIVTVERLVHAGADVNWMTDSGERPLGGAATRGHCDVIKVLLKSGANPNLANKIGGTPLMLVAHQGYVDCLEALLVGGAEVNIRSPQGWTALFVAARQTPASIRVAKSLIQHGADVDAAAEDGRTPLINNFSVPPCDDEGNESQTAEDCQIEFARLLIAGGANVNARTHKGMTCLLSAMPFARYNVLKFLVESGADVDARDDRGLSPLIIARKTKWKEALRLFHSSSAWK